MAHIAKYAAKSVSIPMVIAIFIIFVTLFEFFDPTKSATSIVASITTWATIIVTGIVWVGLVSVTIVWTREVRRRTPGRWYVAAYGLFIIIVVLITGFASAATYEKWGTNDVTQWLYSNLALWPASAHMATQGLWTVGAIWRAFRARSVEAVVFLIVACICFLGAAPIGGLISAAIPAAAEWLNLIIYKASMMAITIGLGIGMIAYIIRFIIFKELTALGVMEVPER